MFLTIIARQQCNNVVDATALCRLVRNALLQLGIDRVDFNVNENLIIEDDEK